MSKTDWNFVAYIDGLSFLTIPKCASQTLLDAAKASGKSRGLKMIRDRNPRGYKISFIRHPESRFLSTWTWLKKMKRFRAHNFEISQHELLDLIVGEMSDDEHFTSQNYYVQNPHFIGTIENFNEDWILLREAFPWLVHDLNHNNRTDSHLNKLEDGISERLQKIYPEDYELYQRTQEGRSF